MDWDFPVIKSVEVGEPDADGNRTVAKKVLRALPRAEAYRYVARDDRRPLLIMRECLTCSGTDDALLNRSESNEKTFIMSKWFHCIKLPTTVLEGDHPFHAFFEGDHPPHLFVAMRDGSHGVALEGDQALGELWEAMTSVLEHVYVKDAEKAVREIQKLHIELDKVDQREDMLMSQFDQELARNGPKSRRASKLRKEMDKVDKEREKLLSKEDALYDLGWKKPEKAEASK